MAASVTITDENFHTLGCEKENNYMLEQNDVVTISTTEATTDGFSWWLRNGYIQDQDDSRRTYGTLQLTEDASVTCDAIVSKGAACVGFMKLGKDSTLNLKTKFVASGGPGSVTLAAGSKIVLMPGTAEGQVSELKIGERGEDAQASYFRIHAAGGYESATISNNNADGEIRLFDDKGYGICLENVYLEVSGTHDINVYAQVKNASLLNTTQGKEFTVHSEGSTVKVINAGTGNINVHNQQEHVSLQSLHIGDPTERGKNIKVSFTQKNGEVSTVSLKTFDQTQGYDSDAKPAGLNTFGGAALDANLELIAQGPNGEPTKDVAIRLWISPYTGTGLNMLGHNVTLGTGLDLMNYSDQKYDNPNIGDSILLFTNVDALTLSGQTYDNQYFNYETGLVSASEFFSSNYTDGAGVKYRSIPELERIESGDGYYLRGWFLEYNQTADNSSWGDVWCINKFISRSRRLSPSPCWHWLGWQLAAAAAESLLPATGQACEGAVRKRCKRSPRAGSACFLPSSGLAWGGGA